MNKRLPWFPFYPSDWLSHSSVMAMTWEERGQYVHLLCVQWREGALPIEPRDIAALIGVSRASALLMSCFPEGAFGRQNKRLEEIRQKQQGSSDRLSEAGKKGRLLQLVSGQAQARPRQPPGILESESESERDTERTKDRRNTPSASPRFDFDAVYALYPKKQGKADGLRACKRKITNPERFEALQRAVANFARYREGQDSQYTPYFSTWINGQWEDWIESPATKPPDQPRTWQGKVIGIAPVTSYTETKDVKL